MEVSSWKHPQKIYFESSKMLHFIPKGFLLLILFCGSKLNHYEMKHLTLKM